MDFSLNCDPSYLLNFDHAVDVLTPSWVAIPRIEDMQTGQNSTLNFDPNPRSKFNVESWIGVKIQRWIMNRGHKSTLNIDPG